MKAFQLVAHGKPGTFRLRDVPVPEPGPDEVVVEVKACGLNHLDLWTEEGALPIPIKLPRTPGCEISGRVSKWGEYVEGWRHGDAVAIQSNLFCGQCEFCVSGDESMCLKGKLLGVDQDGGFAEQVVVPRRALVRLPEGVNFITAAGLTLAASTAMHMLTNRATVNAGEWVLVMGGASGVGSAAIQIAKGLGARVISTGSTDAKRTLALQLGAEAVVNPAEATWTTQVRQITGKRGVDLVVEHVGGAVLEQVFSCLARDGTVVTCGATAGKNVGFDLWPFFVKQQRLIGSYGRNRADMEATLAWAAQGKLKAVIEATLPLEKTGEALARLRARAVLGKLVVEPSRME